ncbi:MAG: hypothetical protein P0Y49_18660 [Candidatus Pedobacter colombiensis]|uniref:DUF5648 domain-containing protein n=1 Tax=Candidatus Pedobacter colombiensis TaxID=3121371 RepID=A0AAJ5W645_9SPHI|nr:hypothetical protein [Pedobacter sp.]WEK18801.1 MAG: hypothetical protein P0Y49_18660 [Pedobacter sp.]
MKYLKTLLLLTLFISLYVVSKAQNPGQGIYGNIDNVTIPNAYLDGEKIKLSNGTTTTVKYYIDMSRSSSGNNTWYPVNMKIGLGYKEGNEYKFFNGAYTFKNGDFQLYTATLYKELTTVIDHSKLSIGSKIYILYENYKPNVPESGWRTEAYVSNGGVIAYDFIPGTATPDSGNPVIGVPPAFTAPEIGSVPLYEYISGKKRQLSTTYYSSYPGFTYNGIFGYVFTSAKTGTVPLYRYTHPTNGNSYYTITLTTTSGYNYDGIVCYVYENQETNAFPVYENYSSSLGSFHRYSNSPDIFPGYRFDGIKFYILQNLSPVPIYQFYYGAGHDHYASPEIDATTGFTGWQSLGVDFKAFKIQAPETVPVYLFYNDSVVDHFISTDRNAVNGYANWEYRGISFYAYSTQVPGTIPIYLFGYNGGSVNHYTTSNPNIHLQYSNWSRVGVAFYAYPAN